MSPTDSRPWWQGRRGDVPPPTLAELGPPGRWDLVAEGLAILGLVVIVAMIVFNWARLPAIVPTHFGPNGRPSAYGSKYTLLVLPAIAILEYVVLTAAAGYPKWFNMPWRITAENRIAQYRATLTFVRGIKAWLVWTLAYFAWATIAASSWTSAALFGLWLILSTVAIPVGGLAVYLYETWRAR